jgi:hypothetical protein
MIGLDGLARMASDKCDLVHILLPKKLAPAQRASRKTIRAHDKARPADTPAHAQYEIQPQCETQRRCGIPIQVVKPSVS